MFVGRVCGDEEGSFSLSSLHLEGSIRHSQARSRHPLMTAFVQ